MIRKKKKAKPNGILSTGSVLYLKDTDADGLK